MYTVLMISLLSFWHIVNFSQQARLSRDNKINVNEMIKVDFDGEQRHGIYRYIPRSFRGHPIHLKFRNIINTTTGRSVYKKKRGIKNIKVRIGDPYSYVTGIQKYKIDYAMSYAVFDTADVQRLVWNVTGNGWGTSIDHVKYSLILPQNVKLIDNVSCFTGRYGSVKEDCLCQRTDNGIVCETTKRLSPYEGLTVLVDFPAGSIKTPGALLKLWWKISLFWPLLIPIIVFVLMYRKWRKYGRDPKLGPVTTLYAPPADLTPIEAGTIIDEFVNSRDLTSEILYLALNGYIKIEEIPSQKDYIITKLKDCDEHVSDFDRKIANGIFDLGSLDDLKKNLEKKAAKDEKIADLLNRLSNDEKHYEIVALSSLRYKYYTIFNEVKDKVYKGLAQRGYFAGNPKAVRDKYTFLGWIFIFLSMFSPMLMMFVSLITVLILALALAMSGAILLIFGRYMPRKTKKGVEALRKVRGLLDFIHRVEYDRLKKFAMEKPEMFKKILPYAVAFGEEAKWARVFEEVYSVLQEQAGLNTVYISGGFGAMVSSMGANATSSPSSSGSSGSGGGFSGGGAGGGGGGAW